MPIRWRLNGRLLLACCCLVLVRGLCRTLWKPISFFVRLSWVNTKSFESMGLDRKGQYLLLGQMPQTLTDLMGGQPKESLLVGQAKHCSRATSPRLVPSSGSPPRSRGRAGVPGRPRLMPQLMPRTSCLQFVFSLMSFVEGKCPCGSAMML